MPARVVRSSFLFHGRSFLGDLLVRRYRVPRLQVQHFVGRLLLGFREGRDWLCPIRVRRIGGCAGRLRGKELRAQCGCRRRCLEVVCSQGEVYAEGGRKPLDDPGGVAEMVRGNGDVDVCLVRIVGALGVVFVNELVVAIGLR